MWKKWLILLAGISIFVILPYSTVLADTYVDIGVSAQGIASGGIANFTITYISETQLNLNWSIGSNVTNVMVRAKYGAYPNDILSDNETPSDGYLVYYGSALSVNDTSMDFNDNAGPIYYRIWAQQPDGTWVITPQQGWKESGLMTLLAIFVPAAILSFIAYKSSFWIMKFFAGLAWWVVAFFWQTNPPSTIVAGSSLHVIALVLFIFVGIAFMMMTFWFTNNENGQEVGKGFRLPFMKPPQEPIHSPSNRERNQAYRDRVNRALGRDR